jgi:hypothetical protein
VLRRPIETARITGHHMKIPDSSYILLLVPRLEQEDSLNVPPR